MEFLPLQHKLQVPTQGSILHRQLPEGMGQLKTLYRGGRSAGKSA